MQPSEDLRREFGDLDIYLFDQLHRGRIVQGMTVLDAGCGGGRNLTYLLRRGFDIWGTDRDEKALASARANAATLAPSSLHCPRQDLEVALNRQTHSVREYAVACNFMYTRVQCSARGCHPAEVEPPCVGNMPCFEEDPETLTWKLSENDAAKIRVPR